MNYTAHVIGGLFLGIFAFGILNYGIILSLNLDLLVNLAIFLLFVFIGATLPDTDCGNSRPTKIMFTLLLIALPLAFYLKIGLIGIAYGIGAFIIACIIYKIFKPPHRGFTHSILFMLIIATGIFILTNNDWNIPEIPESLVSNYAFLGYIFGNLSHLLLDGCWKWK
jgi:membrane-bound metal-dependent hydrolase YbcI (DUF457 family)